MDAALEQLVRERAGGRCEYCHLPQYGSLVPYEIDYIIARKHGGRTVAGNLAVSCVYCNSYKGPNISGVDPATGKIVRLYDPRLHKWSWDFEWMEGVLVGRTAIGRTTARVLEMNLANLVALRETLMVDEQS